MVKINKDRINYREEEFGGLVVDTKTGKIFKLNKTGYKLFCALYNGSTVEDLINTLQNELKIDKDVLKTDIDHFIIELVNRGLISK